jgi:hypothetical protein
VKESLINDINTKDMVKNIVAIGGFALPVADQLGISDQYIILDTYQKSRQSNPSRGIFIFDLSYRSTSNKNITLTRDSLSDLIEMEAYPFYIEKPANFEFITSSERTSFYPKLIPSSIPPPNILKSYNDTFMIEIKELIPNAVSDPNGEWHSFIYTPTLTPSDNLFLIPTNRLYTFTDISDHINSLTLHIKSENNNLVFYDDIYYDILPTYSNVGLDKFLTFNITDHNLSTNDRIHIFNFITGDGVVDTYAQRKQGHLINVINNNQFRLNPDVDLSHLINGVGYFTQQPAYCYIGIDKRRMRIQFRFRKLVRRITNYKSP